LILRIPQVSCSDCKYSELENLKMLNNNGILYNVCAIITVDSPRDLKELTLVFHYNFKKYGVERKDLLNMPEEKLNRPYYFILNSDLQANNFFFPTPENNNLSLEYFKRIGGK